MSKPSFQLKRVYEDRDSDELEVYSVFALTGETKMGRRGLFATGAAIAVTAPALACLTRSNEVPSWQPSENSGGQMSSTSGEGETEERVSRSSETGCGMTTLSHFSDILDVVFSPDGRWLATSDDEGLIKIWDMPSGKLSKTITMSRSPVYALCFGPGGSVLASGSADQHVEIWDIPSGEPLVSLPAFATVNSIAFHPDGKLLAIAAERSVLAVWDVRSEKSVFSSDVPSETRAVAFQPDGGALAVGLRSGAVELLDVPSGRHLRTLNAHSDSVSSLVFGPGDVLVSGSLDGDIKVWSPSSGALIKRLARDMSDGQINSLELGPDGQTIAAATSNKTIELWTLPKGELEATLAEHGASVVAVAFDPSGRWLVSGSLDHAVKIWDSRARHVVNCLFDPASLADDRKAIQYEIVDHAGQVVVYAMPCGSTIPAGATCTCNCVWGTHRQRPSRSQPSRSQPSRSQRNTPLPSRPTGPIGGSTCTCNQVCVCVPVYR